MPLPKTPSYSFRRSPASGFVALPVIVPARLSAMSTPLRVAVFVTAIGVPLEGRQINTEHGGPNVARRYGKGPSAVTKYVPGSRPPTNGEDAVGAADVHVSRGPPEGGSV